MGELGLQEQFLAGDRAGGNLAGDRLARRRLVVVLALVGGVDAAEPLPQC